MKNQKDPAQRRMDAQLEHYINRDPELRFLQEQKKRTSRKYRYQEHLRQVRQERILSLCGKVVNLVACALSTLAITTAMMIMFCLA